MKPLLRRRTFWKGVVAGAASMAVLIMVGVVAVSLLAPKELSQGVRPTWEPTPVYASQGKPDHVTLPPCDTRGKDCVVFDDHPVITFEAPTRNVPEPSSMWLLVAAAAAAWVRNTKFMKIHDADINVVKHHHFQEM